MNIIDGLLNNQKVIGSFETNPDKVGESVVQLATNFGMANPSTPVNSNTKGIIIKKKGKKYTVILAVFTPPVVLNWTSPFSLDHFNKFLDSISTQNKTIGYISLMNVDNGKLIQVAIG